MNLALIGMSGAGKSYLGKKIAERFGLTYLDLDEVMEMKAARSLPEILEALGDERFIEFERDTAIESTRHAQDHLISTGGSIIYAPEAMAHLRDISTVIYLDVPFSAIESRVGGSADRMGRIVGMAGKTLSELYESRVPLYRTYAHHTVEPETLGLDSTLEAIESLLASREAAI